ncbi:peptidase C39 family protein [bacterium]|nr:peptidase C39 family protein [bacterium]
MINSRLNFRVRQSNPKDLANLVRLEQIVFSSDRFTKDHVEYMLTRARASIFVVETEGRVIGVAYILWRKNSHSGRLYNFAVDPEYQKKGVGESLLIECETEAVRRSCSQLTLEVRVDNQTGILFYQKHGYESYTTTPNFYDDGAPAIRMVKILKVKVPDRIRNKVPYYAQTLGFTCGPACLIMAMKFFKPEDKYNRTLEMNLWKEATTIFMTSGFGGTGSYGMALAAAKRGFQARIISSSEKTPFVRSVRIPEKKAIIRLIHDDMKHRAIHLGVGSMSYDFTFEDIKSMLLQGWIPISLISTYRLFGTREPHWVVITGFDSDFVYLHDPSEPVEGEVSLKTRNVKIDHAEFHRMSRYGKDVYRCALFIGPPVEHFSA